MNGIQTTAISLACIGMIVAGVAYGLPRNEAPTGVPAAVDTKAAPSWAPAVLVPDLQADARDHSIDWFDSGSQCRFGCGRPPTTPAGVPNGLPGAVPAPYFDIIEAGFLAETAAEVQLLVRIASLSAGYPFLTPAPQVTRGVDYIVCFESEPGERCAALNVVPQKTGPMATATFSIFSKACGGAIQNDVQSQRPTLGPFQWDHECAFEIPARVEFGTPAAIVFHVPKTLANFEAVSTPWTSVRANVSHFWLQPAAQTHGSISLNTDALPHHHDHFGPVYPSGIADVLAPTPVRIQFAEATEPLGPVTGRVATALPGLAFGDARAVSPLFDLLATSIRDEGKEIVVTQTFAGVSRANAPDFEHATSARLDNGALFEFGAFHLGERWHAYVGTCIHFHCANTTFKMLPLRVIEGTPGHLELRAPREYFGNPGPGTRLTFLLTTTQEINAAYYMENGKDNYHTMTFIDQHLGTLPYLFVGETSNEKVHTHRH